MDATRPRRTRDRIRKAWYAHDRQRRFARFLATGHPWPTPTLTRHPRAV